MNRSYQAEERQRPPVASRGKHVRRRSGLDTAARSGGIEVATEDRRAVDTAAEVADTVVDTAGLDRASHPAAQSLGNRAD